jgi:hypothetical protein
MALGQNGTCKLEGLVLVELTLLKEDDKVLKDRRQGNKLHWNLFDGLGRVQGALT